MNNQFDFIWKVVVAGQGGVGKTTLLHRYIHNEFAENMKMTIGCQFHTQILHREDHLINLVMWDLGGQDRFRFIQGEYIRGAAGAFVLFDLSDERTLLRVGEWINMIREKAGKNTPIVLVGTKLDLVNVETQTRIHEIAQKVVKDEKLMAYTATSSKLNLNVDETILYLVDLLRWQAFARENPTGISTTSQ
ncbi:MAG: Rab family GTPase [Promethearchaeota archaeon]